MYLGSGKITYALAIGNEVEGPGFYKLSRLK